MKIVSLIIAIFVSLIILFASFYFYEMNRKIDNTPIAEAPFDPSKKDIIKLNIKIPRNGLFRVGFYIRHKNNQSDEYIRNNMFTVKYKLIRNGKLVDETIQKPYGSRYSFYLESIRAASFGRRINNHFFKKGDIVDIMIENQYPTEKFKDFEIIFKIYEVRPTA